MAGLKRDSSNVSENSSEPANLKKPAAPWLSKRMKASHERQGSCGTAGDASAKTSTLLPEKERAVTKTHGRGMAEHESEGKSKAVTKDETAPAAGRRTVERTGRRGERDASCSGSRGGCSGGAAAVDASQIKQRTIFVGDLSLTVKKSDLRNVFGRFGTIVSVKVIPGQCYGFVTFAKEESAEAAHKAEQTEEGVVIAGQRVRVRGAEGSLPSWKVGAGGFSFSAPGNLPTSPNSPLQPRGRGKAAGPSLPFASPCSGNPRETFEAAAFAAAVTAGALLYTTGGQIPPETQAPPHGASRQVVAYDDL